MKDPKNAKIIRINLENPDDGKAQALLSIMGRVPVETKIIANDVMVAMNRAKSEKNYTIDHITRILKEWFGYSTVIIDIDYEISDKNGGQS